MYGRETWVWNKRYENKMSVEMRSLRKTCGVKCIRNDVIRLECELKNDLLYVK